MIGGEYEGETFEVYGFRYLYFFAVEGEITIEDVSVREYVYPLGETPEINTDNEKIKGIYISSPQIQKYSKKLPDISYSLLEYKQQEMRQKTKRQKLSVYQL